MTRAIIAAALWLPCAGAATLKPQTAQAFDQYVQAVETRVAGELRSVPGFLWCDAAPDRLRQVREGHVLIQPLAGKGTVSVPDGLIHDWIGAAFIPGATLDKTLALLQDYDHHQSLYPAEVLASRLVSRQGNHFQIDRLRVLKKKMINAVLDTRFDVDYQPLDGARWYSRSASTRITELENYGKPNQRELPPGKDSGYLWRLNAYWKLEQRDGGVYLECEAVSLTRGIPLGLGWMVEPVVRALPQESLEDTLRRTRDALARR